MRPCSTHGPLPCPGSKKKSDGRPGARCGDVMAHPDELLSIVIPMFNAGAVIVSTLDSIARQQGVALEIIVVDDVSTDNSVEVVREWQKNRPHLPLRIIGQPHRGRTLKARLAGVRAATGRDIMFVDADDRLLGEHTLARILKTKREGGFDIAHFRSQFEKDFIAEAFWNAPFSDSPLYGVNVFSAYAAMNFPPVLMWGKIYSAALLREVLPLADEVSIFRLEDVFLCSLLMLFARSYCPVNDYAYLYVATDNWPPEKYAGRVHDLHVMRPFFGTLMAQRNVPAAAAQQFTTFLERRMAFNMNGLCEAMTEELERSSSREALLGRLAPYLAGLPLLSLLCPVVAQTAARTGRMVQRISDGTPRA